MSIVAYWLGNFIYDYILYLILAGYTLLMCKAFNVTPLLGDAFGVTFMTFILYGLAYIPFTYIMGFVFKDYGNAQAGFYFFTFVAGGLLSMVIFILRSLGGTAGNVGLYLTWIIRFVPSFCFG
jgi:hypothetical protein